MCRMGIAARPSLLLTLAGFLLSHVSPAQAGKKAQAMVRVHLRVEHMISIQPVSSDIDAGVVDTGDVSVPIRFRIDANSPRIAVSATVSDLYKGDGPSGDDARPIPVDTSRGLAIDPEDAHEAGVSPFTGEDTLETPEGSLTGHRTEEVLLTSSQRHRFSQEIAVTPTWASEDPKQPEGEYSGYVLVRAMVVDTGD